MAEASPSNAKTAALDRPAVDLTGTRTLPYPTSSKRTIRRRAAARPICLHRVVRIVGPDG